MGFRLYKSVRLGKGVRLNLSKSGVGVSLGPSGLRYSVHSAGRRTTSVGLPGSGVSYRTTRGGSQSRSRSAARKAPPPPPAVTLPKAGLFAPKDEKAFVRGVTAYMQGDHATALSALEESISRDPTGRHVGEEYFAAFSLMALGKHDKAVEMLEEVLASPIELPDPLMQKYGIGGAALVSVTPNVVAELPHGSLAAALLLAELHQHEGRADRAAEVMESLGAVAPDPVFALSLADLYTELQRWDDVLRVSEDFMRNEDDATCQLLAYRARALRQKGLNDAAVEVLKEALKSKKRSPEVLNQARYERALAYEALGKAARARQEFERIYSVDPQFEDVAVRLDSSQQIRK